MGFTKLTKNDVVKKLNNQKDFKAVINYLENLEKQFDNQKISEYQKYIIEHKSYVQYCNLEENEKVVKALNQILDTTNEIEFLSLIGVLKSEFIKYFWELNSEINLLLTYNHDWFQINQYYDIKTISFFDIYEKANLKPQDIQKLFQTEKEQLFDLNQIFKHFCDLKSYDKWYLGNENFPVEMQYLWDVSFNIVKNNFNRIYLLLEDKYELTLLINRIDNSIVGYWIISTNHKWKISVDENGEINHELFANNLLAYQYTNDSTDLEKIVCYILNNKYEIFNNEAIYRTKIIEWDDIDFINETLFQQMIWVQYNHEGKTKHLATGFYLMLPQEIDLNQDIETIFKTLKTKYEIKRFFSKVHKWEICHYLIKK